MSSPLINKQLTVSASNALAVQSPGRACLRDLTKLSPSPWRNNDQQEPQSQSEVQAPHSTLESGNDLFCSGADFDTIDQRIANHGDLATSHSSSAVSNSSPPPMLPHSSFYLEESGNPVMPNELQWF